MFPMAVPLRWTDVALRLGLTILASMLIGYNRREHGKAAGMRTTLLVCLAASVSMLQVNALLPMAGRAPTSFVMNDLMRLPLGILTGVGFIGGGTILRRGSMIVGVTTAATLWLATVIGLCFGGGQIELGALGTAIGLFALWVLERVETRMRQQHAARLSIELDATGPSELDIRHTLGQAGLAISSSTYRVEGGGQRLKLVYDLYEQHPSTGTQTPGFVAQLARQAGVLALQWDGSR
jgi:putative Mg2+ transporter-C (MgtC) family protein